MNLKKSTLILPLLALTLSAVACGPTTGDNSDEITVPEITPSVYDDNWTKGENAIQGANQPVLKNPIGEESNLNRMRRTQNATGIPAKGQSNILVVPLQFSNDSSKYKFTNEALTELDILYFNSDTETTPLSVRAYYELSSYGKKEINGVVSPVVTFPFSMQETILKVQNSSMQTTMADIVDYIYNYLFVETETYYIGDFDSDKDGKIDAISIISNYPYDYIYSDDIANQVLLSLVSPYNCGFSKDLYSKTLVNSYSMLSETFRKLDGTSKYLSNIYCAAIGRMLGLDSYEDTSPNPYTGTYRSVLGYKDMMEGAIGDHNAFSKYQLGWIEPKMYTANSLPQEGLEIQITDLATAGDAILLYTGTHNEFGEYLLIDMYYPESTLNKLNVNKVGPYGEKNYTTRGVRVTKVDSRLVRCSANSVYEFDGTTNFNEATILPNGEISQYVYDYAYTSSSVNKYADYGITATFPLVAALSKNGMNRHLVDYSTLLSNDDLFKDGDVFASNDSVEGFYKDFRFDGNGQNGPLLNINFQVEKFINNKANLKLWRVN